MPPSPSAPPSYPPKISITPITSPSSLPTCFNILSSTFGRQTHDAIWTGLTPGWSTPQGEEQHIAALKSRFANVKDDRFARPETVFLKAVIAGDGDEGKGEEEERIVGYAVWQQQSYIEGYGATPSAEVDVPASALADPQTRFGVQCFTSMVQPRLSHVRNLCAAYSSDPASFEGVPAVFALEICAVHPDFQRRGIAGELVRWGIEEAARRGGLECVTEGSSMGRGVYRRLGFGDDGVGDVVYVVDEELKRFGEGPPNVFLRTGAGKK